MVYELQYINQTVNSRKKQHGYTEIEKKRGEDLSLTRAHTFSDHAEDPESADMRQQILMNTVHLSLFPPHEIV